ncbi:MAG: hypothetical protein PHG66_01640 [Candidatus Colwellbacteria bacterium]|nr:hypothetical protein [Candidatus Colwellbacteria bacterium]
MEILGINILNIFFAMIIISIVISIVISGLFFINSKTSTSTVKSISNESTVIISPPSTDYLSQLDKDSHIHALSNYCLDLGYNYDVVNNLCTYNQKTCVSTKGNTSIPVDSQKYLEWHDPYCLESFDIWKNTCDSYGLPYYQGTIECDPNTQICDVKNGDYPSCIIPKTYCDSKGISFNSSGLGDCYTNDPQEISKLIVGTTITSQFNKDITNITNACKANMSASNCLSNIGMMKASPFILGYDTSKKLVTDLFMDAVNTCENVNDPESATRCLLAALKNVGFYTNPVGYVVVTTLVPLVDGLLSMCGLPPGISDKGVDATIKYGSVAMMQTFTYGKVAADQIADYGQDGINAIALGGQKAIDAISLGGQVAINAIKSGGISAINYISSGGQTAINTIVSGGNSFVGLFKYSPDSIYNPNNPNFKTQRLYRETDLRKS